MLACAVGGAVGGWLVWRAGRRLWARPSFRGLNFRGVDVPTAAGVAVVLPVAAVVAVHGWDRAWGPFLIVAVGFGGFGLLDDLAGRQHGGPGGGSSGFGGHLGALARGRVTTGLLKLAGGSVAALVAAAVWHRGLGLWAVADAALIALAANVANLFDRAPGRAGKVALVSAAALLVATRAPSRLGPVATMAGAAAVLLVYDLRERLMLGDTGANCLGAVLGLGVVEAAGPAARLSVLTLVVVLNALSEIISFGAVIGRVAILRALDQVGRRR